MERKLQTMSMKPNDPQKPRRPNNTNNSPFALINRISHTATRWPTSAERRRELATLDLEFSLAVLRCGVRERGEVEKLKAIRDIAERQCRRAENEIEDRGRRGECGK